jgi:Protein of unknown function (DUF1203)
MTLRNYALNPIDPEQADALRAGGGPTYLADSDFGYPCRQCLVDASAGEQMLLVSHDPFHGQSPYRAASPIFLHVDPCVAPNDSAELPPQLTKRQLSVRSFDREEMMIDGAVIDGAKLRETIEHMFRADESHKLHVHNAGRGCWAVSVERTEDEDLD